MPTDAAALPSMHASPPRVDGFPPPSQQSAPPGIEGDRLLSLRPQLKEERGPDGMLNVAAIADAYWVLHHQHRSAWTLELDLRPWAESF